MRMKSTSTFVFGNGMITFEQIMRDGGVGLSDWLDIRLH